jgi:hypothetical protein
LETDLYQLELHIGSVYGSKEIPPNASDYKPKFIKGARLPHAWIKLPLSTTIVQPSAVDVSYVSEFSEAEVKERKYSTLDVLGLDGFTVVTTQKQAWIQKLEAVQRNPKLKKVRIQVVSLNDDFELENTASGKTFLEKSDIQKGRSYLVRPDQHILEVLESDTTAADVVKVLAAHLGL